MSKVALYGRMKAKPGKEHEIEAFLKQGAEMAKQEPGTVQWFAIREDNGAYSIFDTFTGEIAKALMARAEELFSEPPQIHKITVLAEKE
jgi:quinol monooxygenase YgiN